MILIKCYYFRSVKLHNKNRFLQSVSRCNIFQSYNTHHRQFHSHQNDPKKQIDTINSFIHRPMLLKCFYISSVNRNHAQIKYFYTLSVNNYKYREGWGDKHIYEPSRKAKWGKEPRSNIENFKEGFFQIKTEVRKWREEMKEKFEADPIQVRPGDTDIVFNFKTEDDLKSWKIMSDKDHKEGFSNVSLTLSPTGHGLFSGYTDTRLPDDGRSKNAGYANMTIERPTKSFKRDKCFDWFLYTHIVMRVRGDGRRYLINLLTPGEYDVTWHDMYSYILFTRGGPYWQDVKIPFSKFTRAGLGKIQDKQCPVIRTRIKQVGITAAGNLTAPFRLEIDYIGVHCDPAHKEEFAYELYKIPKYIV